MFGGYGAPHLDMGMAAAPKCASVAAALSFEKPQICATSLNYDFCPKIKASLSKRPNKKPHELEPHPTKV